MKRNELRDMTLGEMLAILTLFVFFTEIASAACR